MGVYKHMSIQEKYWLTLLFTFLRYFSLLMMASGAVFIVLGYYVNYLFYFGLFVWPLLIMWGIVNIKYIRALTKVNKLQFSKILES